MTMHRTFSSVVITGIAVAVAAAALPTAALAQQTDSVAASPADTAKSSDIRSDADSSAGEVVKPAGRVMALPRSAVQQLLGQMVGGGRPRQGGAKATPRVGQGADSAGASTKSSDSTAAPND